MIILLLVLHILIAIALVGVVLLQKSEGGALGMGGGGMSGFMTGRSTANLLTRTTAILALLFFATSLSLVWLSNRGHAPRSIIEQGAPAAPAAPTAPVGSPQPAAPAAPVGSPQPAAPAAPVAPPPQTSPAEPPQPSPPVTR
jgi:preprotein translocase subunit SecG